MKKVDLNSDLGESFGRYTLGMDDRIIPLISSANVACGFHASDPVVMDKTIRSAKAAGIQVGAHPGFPDLMGFGRRNMVVSHEEARNYILYQLGALDAFVKANGMKLQHVKPHGAFYNMAAKVTSWQQLSVRASRLMIPPSLSWHWPAAIFTRRRRTWDSGWQPRFLQTGPMRRTARW